MMRRLLFLALAVCCQLPACLAQTVAGAMPSYNEPQKGEPRTMQYTPQGDAFVCENGKNHFTRAL